MSLVFLLQIKNSIMLGAQYSLIAIGFTLFFGALNVVVFCQGAFYILATFIGAGLLSLLIGAGHLGPIVFGCVAFAIFFLSMCLTGLVGVLVERTTIKPFRNAPLVMPILSTIGVGIVIEQLLKLFYPQGSNPQVFPEIFPLTGVMLGDLFISVSELVILAITIVTLVAIWFFIKKTKIGSHVVAISQDFEAAALMGINVDRAIMVTFFIGACLAAIAGFMNGIYYTVFRYDMGAMAGIKGFSASVVGGLGSVYGAVLGGFLMAFTETFAAAYIPGGSAIRDVFSFGILLLFLILRPSGIIGEKALDKV
ncbi:MAG: branched-chain amino acid ABC transporter permease [Proteobacteria bacterium]|nr:branched-chain amino acid ABC transporter permease [Pseudomonadota bacterium]MBU1057503.1 branched-chain amino acid ABC transporter permease [Pseudomonadota bacterium]